MLIINLLLNFNGNCTTCPERGGCVLELQRRVAAVLVVGEFMNYEAIKWQQKLQFY